MAGGAEAGDRGGVVCAGLVGVDGCPALRGECEPGLQLAEALLRRPSCAGRAVGTSTDPGDGYGRTGFCRCGAINRRRGKSGKSQSERRPSKNGCSEWPIETKRRASEKARLYAPSPVFLLKKTIRLWRQCGLRF